MVLVYHILVDLCSLTHQYSDLRLIALKLCRVRRQLRQLNCNPREARFRFVYQPILMKLELRLILVKSIFLEKNKLF